MGCPVLVGAFGYARLWGWGEKHARVEDYAPDARFERTSILATVRLSGVDALITFKGILNGDIFALYVKYVLALR